MCFSTPKAPKPAPMPEPPPEVKPLGNEALEKKRRNPDAARKARSTLRIPLGTGSARGSLGIPRG